MLAAWQELIDSAWDLGIPPDDASTPRRTVARIARLGSLDVEAQAAAGRVALATEQVLYARETGPVPPLGADVLATREALRASVGRYGRLRAVLLPPSAVRLWWRATERVGAVQQAVRGRFDTVAGAVRTAVRRVLRRPPEEDGRS
ncbi:hypothetical protein ACFQ1I_14070 [Kitasatospora arboriphila]